MSLGELIVDVRRLADESQFRNQSRWLLDEAGEDLRNGIGQILSLAFGHRVRPEPEQDTLVAPGGLNIYRYGILYHAIRI